MQMEDEDLTCPECNGHGTILIRTRTKTKLVSCKTCGEAGIISKISYTCDTSCELPES